VLVPTLQAAVEAILRDSRLNGAIASVCVTDSAGAVLFERNSDTHVVPASNMKLFSNSFGLYELGADWRPETRIWKEADRTVVESTGDPMLTYDQLVQAREKLGLNRRLPVYVHEAFAPPWNGNWEYGDLPNKYAAPVSAFTVDRGSFSVWNRQGHAYFKPEGFGVKVEMIDEAAPENTRYDPFARTIFVKKSALKKDGLVDTLSLPHPDASAASLLGSSMHPTESVPSRAPDLVISGPRAIEIVGACLPPSDNQLAEQLLMLGGAHEGPLGADPYDLAAKRETKFLVNAVGIDPADIKIDDGSGLSRHNFVTTRAIAKLLAWCSRQPTATAWRAALAHAGTGTLSRRLKGIGFDGKTGSLDMVSSLSGYVTTANHETRIVSIVLNEFGCTEGDAHQIQDAIVKAVAED